MPVVHRLWASVRFAHLKEWFYSWVSDSVFSAGKGVSSVDAWYATSIDIEEVLSHTRHSDFHIFVADVVKSFDTVDRDILDCALGSHLLIFLPNSMLIISSAPAMTSTLYWLLLNILYPMFMPWDRRPLLVSACYSAPPRLLVDAWRHGEI